MTGAGEDDIQLVVFRLGAQEFAFDILQVERVVRHQRPAPLPKAPPFLEGIIPYEGGAVPVVDLRKRLELPAPVGEETRLVVLELDGQRVAVVVDAAREVIRVDSTTIAMPGPLVRGLAAPYVAGIVTRGERTIILLNAQRLLTSTERLALAAVPPADPPAGSGGAPREAARGSAACRTAV